MNDDSFAILTSSRQPEDAGRPHLWPLIIIAMILLAVAVNYFGGQSVSTPSTTASPGATSYEARTYTVSYRFGVFSPTNLRIHVGDTVKFRNDGALPVRVVAQLAVGRRTPDFDSNGNIQTGSYFSYTFPATGVYGYYNYANENESGVIIVR
jgi:plastocyanin